MNPTNITTTAPLTATLKVDVAESLKRGTTPIVKEVTLDLAAMRDALPEAQRVILAGSVQVKDGSVTLPPVLVGATYCRLDALPTPDLAGWAEAFEAWLKAVEAERTAQAAAKQARLEEQIKSAQDRLDSITQNPLLGLYVAGYFIDDRADVEKLVTHLVRSTVSELARVSLPDQEGVSVPAETREAVEAVASQVNAQVEALRVQRETEEVEARVRLMQQADAEERAMEARGHLDVRIIAARLDKQAVRALCEQIEPPAVSGEVVTWSSPAGHVCKASFRRLRTIERRLGRECILQQDGSVQTTTVTADGRTLTVDLTLAEAA